MLNLFEKLINEHGSTTIFRERIKLAADQYAVLEREKERLTQQCKHLEARCEHLEAELQKARQIIETHERISKIDGEKQSQEKLGEISERILKYLFDMANNSSKRAIAQRLSVDQSIVAYHLDLLLEKDMVLYVTTATDFHDATLEIDSAGRKYVVEIMMNS